jgi:hypothetical protein
MCFPLPCTLLVSTLMSTWKEGERKRSQNRQKRQLIVNKSWSSFFGFMFIFFLFLKMILSISTSRSVERKETSRYQVLSPVHCLSKETTHSLIGNRLDRPSKKGRLPLIPLLMDFHTRRCSPPLSECSFPLTLISVRTTSAKPCNDRK